MSVNFLDDLAPISPLLSPNSSTDALIAACFRSETSIYLFVTFSITSFLLLLLFIHIFYLAYQQWRKQRSTLTSATSHSELFTYHSITMQLFAYLGLTCFFWGGYIDLPEMMFGGLYIWCITDFGQALFHILTCVERYLAVSHPITYLYLKQTGGVRIRNISIGCVWLLSFGWMAVCHLASATLYEILYSCSMALALTVMSFCSISVLCVLKRPGPGEVGGNKECFNQSKQRAFYTIVAIFGVLLFRSVGDLIGNMLCSLKLVNPIYYCVVVLSGFWLDLPNSLVLPLLFLHRTGKLQCCKQNTETG